MKITTEHYEALRVAIQPGLAAVPPLSEYQKAGMSAKRWRWDALWASKVSSTSLINDIYQYANDDHIDTALRHITGTR